MTWYVVTKDDSGHVKHIGEEADPATTSKQHAEQLIKTHGGHVVTLIEEPEKVVITKEQAEIVEKARVSDFPGSYTCSRLLIDALVNGYTVAKEKNYYVKVPFVQAQGGLWFYINSDDKLDATYLPRLAKKFTMDEIKENGLQDCEKEEVTDDGIR